MAKQTKQTEVSPLFDKYRETLVIYDKQSGEVRVTGGINPAQGTFNYVEPLPKNKGAFYSANDSNMLLNFVRNMKARYEDPRRFEFYRVPASEAVEVYTSLNRKHNGTSDGEDTKFLNQFRLSEKELEKVKVDKAYFPFDALNAAGVDLDIIMDKSISDKLARGQVVDNIDVKHSIDNVKLNDKLALKITKNEIGDVVGQFVSPRAKPEFEEEQFKMMFSPEERAKLAKEETLDKLYEWDINGKKEMCYISFDTNTNRIVPKPRYEVIIPQKIYGRNLNPTQMEELRYGHSIHLEKAYRPGTGEVFSGKISYDVKFGDFTCKNASYEKPYIPQYIDRQLSEQQKNTLLNYGEIDASSIKNAQGKEYKCAIGMNKETNSLYWAYRKPCEFQNQQNNQTQGSNQNQAQAQTQNQNPAPAQTPDNSFNAPDPQKQQGQGRSIN